MQNLFAFYFEQIVEIYLSISKVFYARLNNIIDLIKLVLVIIFMG
ncbi:MAG: hypothetical protein RLZZ338_986 [Cyanobacteriota bacterium]|jgi:hypothetical protein